MKPKKYPTFASVALFTGACALAASSPLLAADIYWNNPGTGSWTDGLNWTGGVVPATADVAYLTNSGTTTITTGTNQVNNVAFTNGSLTMTGGSLALQTTADVITIGTNLSLAQTSGGSPTSVNGAVNLTLSNDASFTGRGKLYFGIGFHGAPYPTGPNLTTANIALSGTSSIQGSTTNGNYVVFGAGGGTVNMTLNDSAFVAKAAGGGGDLLFGDGSGNTVTTASVTVNAHNASSLRSSNGVIIGQNVGAIANVTMDGSSMIQSTTTNTGHVIVGFRGTGTLNMNEHAKFAMGDAVAVGFDTSGTGTLNYASDATSTVRTAINIGYGNLAKGTLNMTSGRIETAQAGTESYWGGGNTTAIANVNVSGTGSILSASALMIGANGSEATVVLSENADVAFTGTTPKAWFFGANGASSLTMSGNSKLTAGNTYVKSGDYGNSIGSNTITLSESAALSFAGKLTLGHYGNAGSTSTITIGGGATLTAADHITIGRDDANTDNGINTQVLLNGGTLATQYIEAGGGITTAIKNTIVGNGGTIKALAGGDFFRNSTFNAARTYVKLETAGLTFDTNGFNVSFLNDLSEGDTPDGGLTKIGAGILSMDGFNTYLGTTTIAAGTLAGTAVVSGPIVVQSGASFAPGSPAFSFLADVNVDLAAGAKFVANIAAEQGAGDALLEVTEDLDITGAILEVNAAEGAGTGPYTIATFTSLTGTFASVPPGVNVTYNSNNITITLSAPSGSFATWASANGVTGGVNGDSDLDGIKNLVEYALDLDPDSSDGAPGTFAMGVTSFAKRDEAVDNGDVTYTIQTSVTLEQGSWVNVLAGDPALADTDSMISYTLPTGQPKRFVRLLVSVPTVP